MLPYPTLPYPTLPYPTLPYPTLPYPPYTSIPDLKEIPHVKTESNLSRSLYGRSGEASHQRAVQTPNASSRHLRVHRFLMATTHVGRGGA